MRRSRDAPVLDQVHRDREIWIEYVSGRRQVDIAEARGMSQSAVSQAVVRYRNTLPPLDKDEELDRALDLINELIATHAPRAKQGHLGATRMVDRLVNTKVKLAGLQAPTKVEVETHGQVEHAHVVVEPGRTLEELLSEWAAEGRVKVQGQLVRMDGGRDG